MSWFIYLKWYYDTNIRAESLRKVSLNLEIQKVTLEYVCKFTFNSVGNSGFAKKL